MFLGASPVAPESTGCGPGFTSLLEFTSDEVEAANQGQHPGWTSDWAGRQESAFEREFVNRTVMLEQELGVRHPETRLHGLAATA